MVGYGHSGRQEEISEFGESQGSGMEAAMRGVRPQERDFTDIDLCPLRAGRLFRGFGLDVSDKDSNL